MSETWTDQERLHHIAEAIEAVDIAFDSFANARTPLQSAAALTDLANAASDLKSWHPSYDYETGTLSWEREAER